MSSLNFHRLAQVSSYSHRFLLIAFFADSSVPSRGPEFVRTFSRRDDVTEFFHRKLHDATGRLTFVGRGWLEAEVARHVNDAKTKSKAILLTGDPGIGKSTFMAYLVRQAIEEELTTPAVNVLAYHACMADNQKSLSASEFVRSIASLLCERLPVFAARAGSDPTFKLAMTEKECRKDPVSSFVDGVLRPLAKCELQGVHCLLVDSLDEALLTSEKVHR